MLIFRQQLADQVRIIIKKSWFSDLDIQQIHQKINNEQDSNTAPNTSGINNEKQPYRNEPPLSENGSITQPNSAQPNKQELTITKEPKINLENLKRIMSCEKITLPSLRIIEWRTVKTETNKLNQVLPYISTNNRTELNELTYAGAKLVCEKIRIPSKSTKKKIKIKMGHSTGKNLRKQAQIIEQRKNAGTCRDQKRGRNTKRKDNNTTWGNKLESSGERRKIKEIPTKDKTIQNRTFQNSERKFYQQLRGDHTKTYQWPDARETERFWTKICQPKNKTEKLNG